MKNTDKNSFDADIASTANSPGHYSCEISDRWNVVIGPNGGYVAAILLGAMQQELARVQPSDLQRPVRGATFHFLSASVPGPALIDVHVEKLGRSFSTLLGKIVQNERTIVMALATFAPARENAEFCDYPAPVVALPDEIPEKLHMNRQMPGHVQFRDQYDQRLAIGPIPPERGDKARVGGWMRHRSHRSFDALLLTAISDSWYPSTFARDMPALSAPTIDHTVHFFAPTPDPAMKKEDFVLVEFETCVAQSGFLQEDGRIWSPDGKLLAQSRQLALMMPANL